MTPRELVLSTLEFTNTSGRAPRQIWLLPAWVDAHWPNESAAIRRDYPDDILHCPPLYKTPLKTVGDPYKIGKYVDEWGCIFTNVAEGIFGEVKDALVPAEDEDWEDVSAVHIPRELLSFDIEEVNRFCRATDRFVLPDFCARPFERLQFIRGSEQLYMDLVLRPEGMTRFIAEMHAFHCEVLERWAQTEVDALYFMDDWGAQRSLLINPGTWRELFKPLYKDYIDIAHRHGKKAFMHSDGCTLDIIPDLIELGLDAFNTQLFCIGLEKLAPFKGQLCFWGEIDRQHLLPNGTTAEISEAVEAVYHTLWQNGGCIAQCEFGPAAKPENVRAVFESWDGLRP